MQDEFWDSQKNSRTHPNNDFPIIVDFEQKKSQIKNSWNSAQFIGQRTVFCSVLHVYGWPRLPRRCVHVVFYSGVDTPDNGAWSPDSTCSRLKQSFLAVNIFLIDMLLGLSKWRLDSIQTDKSENYEHLRDGLLLHHRSVMLIFNFLPDLGRFQLFSNYVQVRQSCDSRDRDHVTKLTGQLSRVSSNASFVDVIIRISLDKFKTIFLIDMDELSI